MIGYASSMQGQESQGAEAVPEHPDEVDLLQPTKVDYDGYGAIFALENFVGFAQYEKPGETNRELLYTDSYINQSDHWIDPAFTIIGYYNYDYYSQEDAKVSGRVGLAFYGKQSHSLFHRYYPITALSLIPFDVELSEKVITSKDLGLEEGMAFSLGTLDASLGLYAALPEKQKAYEDFELEYSAGLRVTHSTDGFGKFPLTFIDDDTAIFGSLVSSITLAQFLFHHKGSRLSITDAHNIAGINIVNTSLEGHVFQLSFQNFTQNFSSYLFAKNRVSFAKYAERVNMYNRVSLLYVYKPLSLVNIFDVYRLARTPNNAFDSKTKTLTLAYTVQYDF